MAEISQPSYQPLLICNSSALLVLCCLNSLIFGPILLMCISYWVYRSTLEPYHWPKILFLRYLTFVALLLCAAIAIFLTAGWCEAVKETKRTIENYKEAYGKSHDADIASAELDRIRQVSTGATIPIIAVIFGSMLFWIRATIRVERVWPHSAWIPIISWTLATLSSSWIFSLDSMIVSLESDGDLRQLHHLLEHEVKYALPISTALLLFGTLFWFEAVIRAFLFRYFWRQPQSTLGLGRLRSHPVEEEARVETSQRVPTERAWPQAIVV